MIFKFKKHNADLYTTLLKLSRNVYFYEKIKLKDCFETRIYLMFLHFSIILIIYKKKSLNFDQTAYDNLFHSIENNLRELGFGDVAVNKKMKNLNKIFYDILLKINEENNSFKISKRLINMYFTNLNELKYKDFEEYFLNFYDFCFEIDPKIMIKESLKFKVIL